MSHLSDNVNAIARREDAEKKSAEKESALAKKAYEFTAVMYKSDFEDIGHRILDKSLKPSVYFQGDKAEYAGFKRVWNRAYPNEKLPKYY